MSNNSFVSQIYRSRKNVLELMEHQGYDVGGYAHFNMSEIHAMVHKSQLDMLLDTKNEDNPNNGLNADANVASANRKIYIHYYLGKMLGSQGIHDMIDDLYFTTETLKKTDTLYIIMFKDNLNATLMDEIKHIWDRDQIHVVVESVKYLQFNILKHKLVPKHTPLTEKETQAIMDKYNIKDISEFPSISRFDPVARAICLRPGQCCHILRPSTTSITTDYYRVCV